MNYIREKRERMKREYGRDIWEKITDEKIYQIVQGFLSDDVLQNENGNLKSGENGGANKMENKFKIKDDTVFQNYERYDDDETIYFDDSG
jgi:hypothetical protein